MAVLNCELPRPWAWPLAAVAALYGAWLARRELRRPPQALVVAAGRFHLDGVELCQPRLHWRGPLACLSFRQGRRRRYRIGWPDALGATARRELRLAASVITPTPDPRSMAP
ncbi:hypothetical protein [Lysobacter silvisoli]|uniref:hypothetical protein n=1 Tax=Lysobacter silvisoli TaxID=2293254 RepID=UPI001E6113FD|nr:hypothetical protein [Lysobacter silvisoli]